MPKGRSKRTSLIASITNRPTGGGSKKEGLAPSVGTGNLSVWKGMGRAYGTPEDRDKLFCINQLGSVNPRVYQTRAPSDGVRPCPKKRDRKPKNLEDAVDKVGGEIKTGPNSLLGKGRIVNLSTDVGTQLIDNNYFEIIVDNLFKTTGKKIVEISLEGQTQLTSISLTRLLDNEIADGQLRSLNLSRMTGINSATWHYMAAKLLEQDKRVVNLDVSHTNIPFDAIMTLLGTNSLVTLNLDFLVPGLTDAQLKEIAEKVKENPGNLRVLSMQRNVRAPGTSIKNTRINKVVSNTINLPKKVATSDMPAILDLEIVPNVNEKKIIVTPTIRGENKETIGVKFNWFVKKQVYKKGKQWVKINGENVNENSNKLQYKLPNKTTGSRGIKENSELKCEVTPFLKKGAKTIDGKPQEIELIKDDWKTMKKVIKDVEKPLVLSVAEPTSEDQNQYSPSDLVLAVEALLYSTLDTAIISGTGLSELDFNYLFNKIKSNSPSILRIIMVGTFPNTISSQLPTSVIGQDFLGGLNPDLFRGVIVPEPEIPLVINNPTFDVESNQEIRETIISEDENKNEFFVSYISLKGSGEYFQTAVFR
jgi:hypothetical protein